MSMVLATAFNLMLTDEPAQIDLEQGESQEQEPLAIRSTVTPERREHQDDHQQQQQPQQQPQPWPQEELRPPTPDLSATYNWLNNNSPSFAASINIFDF